MKFAKIALLFALTVALISLGCGSSAPPETEPEEAEVKEAPPPEPAEEAAEESAEEAVETAELRPPEPKPEPPAPKPKPKPKVEDTKPVVIMETSKGTIKIELDAEKAPETVKNFLQYVDDKFYDGTIFHRVIKGFMIQGGGFSPSMNEKRARATIKNESSNGLKNVRGTLAMARRPDPHSASAQFFIQPRHQRLSGQGPSTGRLGVLCFRQGHRRHGRGRRNRRSQDDHQGRTPRRAGTCRGDKIGHAG